MHNITLIPDDGVGPEISEAVTRVVEATGVSIDWDVQDAGTDVFDREGTPLPDRVIKSIKRNKRFDACPCGRDRRCAAA